MAGKVTKDGQSNVDEQICTAACDHEDTNGRQEDGDDDQKDL